MGLRKGIVFGFLLFVFVMAGLGLFRVYRQPLGPALELPTATRVMRTLTSVPIKAVAAIGTETEIPATSTATPQPLCSGPAVMNILAIGSDARGDHYLYGLADVIRLVSCAGGLCERPRGHSGGPS
jgi:hypothetical protein